MDSAVHLLNNRGQVFLDIRRSVIHSKKKTTTTTTKKNIKDGVVCKAKGEEVAGRGEAEYDLKAGSTSCPHPIVVAFSPLVGERSGSRGPRVVGNYEKFYELFLKLLFNLNIL